jgi:hypothetical protein
MREFCIITVAVVTAQLIRPALLAAVWLMRDRMKNFVPVEVHDKKRFAWLQAWAHRSVDCY